MEELDVINEMLASMGEAPLNQIDEDHPYVASGRRYLTTTSARLQAVGWWFNTELLSFVPDADSSFVYIPNDIISAEGARGLCRNMYTQRGRRLYDLTTGTYVIDESPVYLKCIRNVPFDDLPGPAQDAVCASAVLRFQKNYDADQAKTQLLSVDQRDALTLLKAEHTRQVKTNFIYQTTVGSKIAQIAPMAGGGRLPYPGIGVK